jgi:hypothetical protein
MIMFLKIHQYSCKHTYKLSKIQLRNEEGVVEWPCSKCEKMWQGPYGMAVDGKIMGENK